MVTYEIEAQAYADTFGPDISEIVRGALVGLIERSPLNYQCYLVIDNVWVGMFDNNYPSAFPDVDYGLKSWSHYTDAIDQMAAAWNQGIDFTHAWFDHLASFWRIPQDLTNLHHEQDFRSPYLYIQTTDTPRFRPGLTPKYKEINPPCGNSGYVLTSLLDETRSQTWGIQAAVRVDKSLPLGIKARIAKIVDLPLRINAAVATNPVLQYTPKAAIQCERQLSHSIRSALKTDRDTQLGVKFAAAANFSLPLGIKSAVRTEQELAYRARAAIRGETQRTYGIMANIIVSREDEIYLEIDGTTIQEIDLRGAPNWPSQPRDWRTDPLG